MYFNTQDILFAYYIQKLTRYIVHIATTYLKLKELKKKETLT